MVANIDHIAPHGRYSPTQAAKALGIGRTTLYRWMHQLRIRVSLGRRKRFLYFMGEDMIRAWKYRRGERRDPW